MAHPDEFIPVLREGEIMPLDPDYGLHDEDTVADPPDTGEQVVSDSEGDVVSSELADLLLARKAEIETLRQLGRTNRRIQSIIARKYGPTLARLAARGAIKAKDIVVVDTSTTRPPSPLTRWAQRVYGDNSAADDTRDARSRAYKDD